MKNDKPTIVLIVEDDLLIRMFTVDMLERAGFVAIEANNADEALVILEARPDITLLLTDINMPGSMDGLKLAHAARHRWPPIKIIVVSSHSPECDLPIDGRFVGKPYHIDAMISEIHSLLGPN